MSAPGRVRTGRGDRHGAEVRLTEAGRTTIRAAAALALALGLAAAAGAWAPRASAGTEVWLAAAARDSMTAVFLRSNEAWDRQADLNMMERWLGTVGPTQREFLGCLQGRLEGGRVVVEGFEPARDMRQLPMAVTGHCRGVPRVVGTWHTHPYRPDLENRPVKSPVLSAQDLATFAAESDAVILTMWDADSVDAAVRHRGAVVHPAPVRVYVDTAPPAPASP